MYKIPVTTVDKIFNDYSRHWANMSGQAIMTKYKLKVKARQLIKSNIWLYKDSHILSPLSLDIAESEWKVDEIVREVSYSNFEDKNRGKFKEAHTDTLEKVARKYAKTLGTIDWFMEYIAPLINSIQPIKVEVQKNKFTKAPKQNVFIGDEHLGKINTDQVVSRMDSIAKDIIKLPWDEVTIVNVGDIFETLVQGWMHSWQIESMNWIYWADLFMYGVNVFVQFLTPILKSGKKVNFVGIWWNHDRASQLNEWDNERMYATIFYEMLRAYMIKCDIKFQIIREKIGMYENDWIQYLIHHWEKLDKKNPEKIAWKFADTGKHVVLVSAHEHNEQIYTGKNVTHLKINALAGQNTYDKDLLMDSYPWYAVVTRNEFGLPDIYSKRLP